MSSYEMNDIIYSSDRTMIYRGRNKEDQTPVVIKILQEEHPSKEEIEQFKHEYKLAESLKSIQGVLQPYEFTSFDHLPAIILEDFHGKDLSQLIKSNSINLINFLNIAIQLLAIIGEIHKKGVIHKDIKPHNIIIHLESMTVKITDFGISTRLSKEEQTGNIVDHMEGTLAYVSPEQTGRMNRSIDYRTDFYSLGVTFYELLIGKVPFEYEDPLEMIHHHIAVAPKPPVEVDPSIPKPISDIVMKLMSKNPEERYQSSFGAQYDLEVCRNQFKETGRIEPFPLANHEMIDRLNISKKFVGRETEIQLLLESYLRTKQGSRELNLVKGTSGLGKTSLVFEMQQRTQEERKLVAQGKFDASKKETPFEGLKGAFTELIKSLFKENKDQLELRKKKILATVGSMGKVIIDFIPNLELILGEQPEVTKLSGAEAQSRFKLLFQDFIKVFATKEEPLILFFDDIQWADYASLDLIKSIITDASTSYLQVIFTLRDDEAPPEFIQFLDDLSQTEVQITHVPLHPLDFDGVNHIVKDTLCCPFDYSKPLTEMVVKKTNSNPLFVIDFLAAIHENGWLTFDPTLRKWTWDLEKIESMTFSDNVLELMIQKVEKLPEALRHLLMYASILGEQFELSELSHLIGKPVLETSELLFEVIEDGFITPVGEDYKLVQEDKVIYYRFVHHRIQMSIYAFVSKEVKSKVHYQVAHFFLKRSDLDYRSVHHQPVEAFQANLLIDWILFDLLRHYNEAREQIETNEEQEFLYKLNWAASRKASNSSAFEQSLVYIRNAMEFFPQWFQAMDTYTKTDLLYERAILEYLSSRPKEAIAQLEEALTIAESNEQKGKIYYQLTEIYTVSGDIIKSIEKAKEGLSLIGITIPTEKEALLQACREVISKHKELMKHRTFDELYNAPDIEDPMLISLIKLMINSLRTYTYSSDYYSRIFIGFTMANLQIEKGFTLHSPYSLGGFSIIYSTYNDEQRDFLLTFEPEGFTELDEIAYQWSCFAIRLCERFNHPEIISATYNIHATMAGTGYLNMKKRREYLQICYQKAIEAGKLVYAGNALINELNVIVAGGYSFDILQEGTKRSTAFSKRTRNKVANKGSELYTQFTKALLGETKSYLSYSDDTFDDDAYLKKMKEDKFGLGLDWYYVQKEILCHLYNLPEGVVDLYNRKDAGEVDELKAPMYLYFTILFSYDDFEPAQQERLMAIIKERKKDHIDELGLKGNENDILFKTMLYAGFAKIEKRFLDCIQLVDQSIKLAKEIDDVVHEGLMNEEAGRLFLAMGGDFTAKNYIKEAWHVFKNAGYRGKVKQLEAKYPEFLAKESRGIQPGRPLKQTITKTTSTGMLDMASIMKASQAITGEIKLSKLLSKMMKIVIENAGADKGVLMLERKDQLFIEAETVIDEMDVNVLQSLPLESKVPESIINYVYRSKEKILLEDAANDHTYSVDPYIKKHQTKSILATPLINQGKLVGILYLENNLTNSAFTEDNVAILKMLSTQIAIAIENALLYEQLEDYNRNLEQKVDERTQELNQANSELFAKNEIMMKELQMAQRVQQNIVPKESDFPNRPEMRIGAKYLSMESIGGDLFDIIPISENRYGILMVDVSGHGVPAALITTMVKVSVHSHAMHKKNTAEVLAAVNQDMFKFIGDLEHYLTGYYAVIDLETGILQYTNAGHHPAMLYKSESHMLQSLDTKGFIIGSFENIFYDFNEVRLRPGDRILLYTDGIIEAKNTDSEFYTYERLATFLFSHSTISPVEFVEQLIQHVEDFCAGKEPDDDRAVLYLEYIGKMD